MEGDAIEDLGPVDQKLSDRISALHLDQIFKMGCSEDHRIQSLFWSGSNYQFVLFKNF